MKNGEGTSETTEQKLGRSSVRSSSRDSKCVPPNTNITRVHRQGMHGVTKKNLPWGYKLQRTSDYFMAISTSYVRS